MVESTVEMKRKSINKQNSTGNLQDKMGKDVNSPNQKNNAVHLNKPIGKKNTDSNIKTPKKQAEKQNLSPTKVSNKKRKIDVSVSKKDEDSVNEPATKKNKLEMFAGSATLDEQKNQNASSQNKKKVKEDSVRYQKKKEKIKKMRMQAKIKIRSFFKQAISGEIPREEALAKIQEHLSKLQSRPQLSRTAKKNLRKFKHLEAVLKGEATTKRPPASKQTKLASSQDSKRDNQQKGKKNKKEQIKKQEDEPKVSDESEEDEDSDAEKMESEQEDEEGEGEEEENEESAEEESGDDNEESEEGEEEEESEAENEPKSENESKIENKSKNSTTAPKKARYVLFVGNLPYDVSIDDIKGHFAKIGDIVDVRLPKDDKTQKARGFAFVELKDKTAYEKALSLHHSFLKNRRINVQYTKGGGNVSEKEKKTVKAKNFKLHQMRKEGKLEGSKKENQKRSARRNKQKNV